MSSLREPEWFDDAVTSLLLQSSNDTMYKYYNSSVRDPLLQKLSYYRLFHTRVFSWLFPLLMLLGVWGNASCLLVLLRHPKCFPFSVRLCMLSTCCVDLLLVGGKSVTHYLAPAVLGRSLGVPNYRSESNYPMCVAYYLVTLWLLHGSPFLRLGFCLHSLVVTLSPMRQRSLLRRCNIALWQALLLLLSFVPCIRVASAFWSHDKDRCVFRQNDWIQWVYQLYTVFASRLLVLSALLTSLAIMLLSLRRSRRNINGSIASGRSQNSVRHPSSAPIQIFVSTGLIFIVCEAPFSVLQLLDFLGAVDCTGYHHRLGVLLNHVMYLNPAINWIPYLIGAKFRRHYCVMLTKVCCRTCGMDRNSGNATAGSYSYCANAAATIMVRTAASSSSGRVHRV